MPKHTKHRIFPLLRNWQRLPDHSRSKIHPSTKLGAITNSGDSDRAHIDGRRE